MITVPSPVSSRGRVHMVLIPGFAGFDALGQIEYYAGTTDRYLRWRAGGGSPDRAVVIHYFDNLPTAGVQTRADRLRAYLAKRIARGEIQDGDTISLIGHSTGGLDIRRMLSAPVDAQLRLDGGAGTAGSTATTVYVSQSEILDKVSRVVFVSVPQFGTNIADWVRGHTLFRRGVIDGLYRSVQGAAIPPVEKAISGLLGEREAGKAARSHQGGTGCPQRDNWPPTSAAGPLQTAAANNCVTDRPRPAGKCRGGRVPTAAVAPACRGRLQRHRRFGQLHEASSELEEPGPLLRRRT